MMPQETKTHKPRKDNSRNRSRIDYFIRKKNGTLVRVCATTFMSICNIKRRRLNGICSYFLKHGCPRPETRGGARISEKHNKVTKSIIDHISSLRCRESHYGRSKSVRGYLPPELSTKKLYRTWKQKQIESSQPTCSYAKYYNVFATKFNLAYGNPRSDVCSFCELKKIEISKCADLRTKQAAITMYRLHKLRSKKFFQLLKCCDDDTVKICFDMQQNQPLPKLSIGEVYYSRQIWIYNLTIMIVEPVQNKENTFIYTWTEADGPRGSNEIVSCVIDFLKRIESRYTGQTKKIMLFSDSCAAQNKNSAMIGALLHFVQNSETFTTIEHIFPIRGHSYMPPDRVFGRMEKQLRRIEIITSPEEYYSIYEQHATVLKVGEVFPVLDYKGAAKTALKAKLPMKIMDKRVIQYQKGKYSVGGKEVYSSDYCYHVVLKKTISFNSVYRNIEKVELRNCISTEKLNDVKKLLQYCNLSEAGTTFFNNIFNLTTVEEEQPETIFGSNAEEDTSYI